VVGTKDPDLLKTPRVTIGAGVSADSMLVVVTLVLFFVIFFVCEIFVRFCFIAKIFFVILTATFFTFQQSSMQSDTKQNVF